MYYYEILLGSVTLLWCVAAYEYYSKRCHFYKWAKQRNYTDYTTKWGGRQQSKLAQMAKDYATLTNWQTHQWEKSRNKGSDISREKFKQLNKSNRKSFYERYGKGYN